MKEREEANEGQYLLEFTNDRGEFVAGVGGMCVGTLAILGRIWRDQNQTVKGIGSAMLARFETWARDRGANAIVSTYAPDEGRQDESLAFYRKNDFSIDAKSKRLYKKL